MKKRYFIYCLAVCLFAISCNQNTPKEEKEINQVDSMVKQDDARMDSMKKALGL